VRDTVVERVLTRVWQGMGFVALHSAHYSKPFKRLMGTTCSLTCAKPARRGSGFAIPPPDRARIDRYFEIPNTEMYGEPFAIAAGRECLHLVVRRRRSLPLRCTWKRGNGKIFYFRPDTKFTLSTIIRRCGCAAQCSALGRT
jgi:trehalose utilization protein